MDEWINECMDERTLTQKPLSTQNYHIIYVYHTLYIHHVYEQANLHNNSKHRQCHVPVVKKKEKRNEKYYEM